jgi:hypothetical protein
MESDDAPDLMDSFIFFVLFSISASHIIYYFYYAVFCGIWFNLSLFVD